MGKKIEASKEISSSGTGGEIASSGTGGGWWSENKDYIPWLVFQTTRLIRSSLGYADFGEEAGGEEKKMEDKTTPDSESGTKRKKDKATEETNKKPE